MLLYHGNYLESWGFNSDVAFAFPTFLLYNSVIILLLQVRSANPWIQVRLDNIILQKTRGGRWPNRSSHRYHGISRAEWNLLWGAFGGMVGRVEDPI